MADFSIRIPPNTPAGTFVGGQPSTGLLPAPAGPGDRYYELPEGETDFSYYFTIPYGVQSLQISGSGGGGGGGGCGNAASATQHGGGGGGGGVFGSCRAGRGLFASDGALTIELYHTGAGGKVGLDGAAGGAWAVYDGDGFVFEITGGGGGGAGSKAAAGVGGKAPEVSFPGGVTDTVQVLGNAGTAGASGAGGKGGDGDAGVFGGVGGAGGAANAVGSPGVGTGGGGGAGARTSGAGTVGGAGGGVNWVRVSWPPGSDRDPS